MIHERVRDTLSKEPKRDYLDLHEALANVVAACEQVLNEGNMAAQGHWDATDKMKSIAFEALSALDLFLREIE